MIFVCDKNFLCCDYQYWDTVEDIEQDAKECGHLIEVEPVQHGRWIAIKIPNEWDKGQCSICKSTFSSSVWGTNYCPNCGAKMDLH